MRLLKKIMIGAVAALGLAAPSLAAERAIIVLDGSGSMWAQIDGEARISIARETLSSVLADLPGDLELGLMSYGHREKGNCGDIEMLVEPAAGTGAAIAAAANKINPKGMTPLSDAVRLAAEDLRFTEQKATVILITDGLETCEVDPCALGSELENQGIDFTTHVLGFGLSDEEGRAVACLAENTGGQYLSAQDGDDLVDALTATVAEVAQAAPAPVPEPEPAILDENFTIAATLAEGGELLNRETGKGLAWELRQAGNRVEFGYGVPDKQIAPGDYELFVRYGPIEQSQPVTITADTLAAPYFVLNAGKVIVRAYASEGEPVAKGASIDVVYSGGDERAYTEAEFIVPAGEITVTAKVGQGEVSESFTLAAGETVEKELVAGVGLAVINASYVEGMPVQDSGMAVSLFKAAKAIDGSRERVGYGYGPGDEYQLVPGNYVAMVKMGEAIAEAPFVIESGERTEVDVVLDAGVAAITMPGAYSFEMFSAKTDLQGNRQRVGFGYDAVHQTTLPGGDYVVVVTYDDDSETEASFSVTPGERTELTVEKGVSKSKTK